MTLDDLLKLLDYLGTYAFALSGALKAGRRRMDMFGMFVLALVTAVGGGTIRDLILGRVPVFWLVEPAYLGLAVLATVAVFALQRWVERAEGLLLVFDAVGLGVFTVIGTQLGLQEGLGAAACIALGCVTGIGGGLLRDVLALSHPVVLHREIYALASVGGAALLVGLDYMGVPTVVGVLACCVATTTIRLLSLHYGWTVPGLGQREETA
ncbi:MAG TPA: trimeric intracellular cation channel family protein [Armatimonadota bacterium]|jgi:uncharacterized membrane protein YeiH